MRIYIDTKEIAHALKSINWPSKPNEIILENALLVANNQGIQLFRTNLDLYVTINIQGKVQEAGLCLIPIKKALAILKYCKGEILLKFDGECLRIGDYSLDTMPAEEYPLQPSDDDWKAIGTIQGHVLAYAIKTTAPWKDNSGNPALDHFCLKNGQLVTSEGHTLCLVETGLQHEQQLTLNGSLSLLEKVDLEGKIHVAKTEEYLALKGDNFEALVRLMDRQYPNYEAIFPTKGYPLKINAEALRNGLKEAIAYVRAITKRKKEIPIHLQWLEDRMEIRGVYGEDKKKEFRRTIAEHQMQFAVSIVLNAVWFLTAIKNLRGELTIWHPGEKTGILVTDGKTFKYLQMPMAPGDDSAIEYYLLPEDSPLQEIPYAPDLSAIPKSLKKAKRKGIKRKAAKPSMAQEKALAELKARADFWEAEALKKEVYIRNLEAELEKLQESHRALLQFQALRPNGKGRYAVIDGHQYLFSQGKILDEDGSEVGHYDRKGNGEIKGQSFKIQREYVIALN